MLANLFRRTGPHYILCLMLMTRALCVIEASLLVGYITLVVRLTPTEQTHLVWLAALWVTVAVYVTTWFALRATRVTRSVLARQRQGRPISNRERNEAGRESAQFARTQILQESKYDLFLTTVPLSVTFYLIDHVSWLVLLHINIAGFLGVCSVLLKSRFLLEHGMVPVTQHLLDDGAEIDFDAFPATSVGRRMTLVFGLTIIMTVVFIGNMATQRAHDIGLQPETLAEAVYQLKKQTLLISGIALLAGLGISRLLARSIASRIELISQAMRQVEAGDLEVRLQPTGNDELDHLARQFNQMIEKRQIHEEQRAQWETELQEQVALRTEELSLSQTSLEASLNQLQEYDQLKTEFFSNVSHELRTPLTMILSPLERLLNAERGSLSDEQIVLLQIARKNGERLLKQVNQILDFSRLEVGRVEVHFDGLDVNDLVTELVLTARPLAEDRGVHLDTQLDNTLPVFVTDADKVETILSNLISNALKFTPRDGQVLLETWQQNEQVMLSVTDTGPGIAAKDRERVFERFIQLDGSAARENQGTGLGLALAKELAEKLQGSITLESEPGVGSCFTLTLPCCSTEEVHLPAKNSRSRQSHIHFADLADHEFVLEADFPEPTERETGRQRILIVEDTADMRTLLVSQLSNEYELLTACDGQEGLETALREHPDLIISDVMMPRMHGYEFCRKLKANTATGLIPFLMLTAKADQAMELEGFENGADDYLAKPFSEQVLKARVRALLKMRELHRTLEKRKRELEQKVRELNQAQDQLVHSEKMASVGQLAAGVAHEINNAINVVSNGIKPLHRKTLQLQDQVLPALPPETHHEITTRFDKILQLAEVVRHGADRTSRIVTDLKTFSHPGSEEAELFDVHQSLDVCVNLLAKQLGSQITVQRNYQASGLAYGPPARFDQVWMNLLTNAVQAIEGTGEITLITREELAGSEERTLVVGVRDTGCGINDDDKMHIFDPFFTTKPPGEGTGLGLSISYGIVTRNGGTLTYESCSGVGTEFRVSLPMSVPLDLSTREPAALAVPQK